MRVFVFLIFCFAISIKSHAALTLTVNSIAKTYALTGSDAGTPGELIGDGDIAYGILLFQITGIGGMGGQSKIEDDSGVTFRTNVGTPGGVSPNTLDTKILLSDSGSGTFQFSLYVSDPVEQTITGEGVHKSYASLAPGNQARLESLNGQSLARAAGSDFSDVTVTVVPEPHHYAILGGAFCLGFGAWRHRRSNTQPA